MIRGRVMTTAPALPVCSGWLLLIQVFAQAIRDVRSSDPRVRDDALDWLNAPETHELAQELGIDWGVQLARITRGKMPQRHTRFAG